MGALNQIEEPITKELAKAFLKATIEDESGSESQQRQASLVPCPKALKDFTPPGAAESTSGT